MINLKSLTFVLLTASAFYGCKPSEKKSDSKKQEESSKNIQDTPVSNIVDYLTPQISNSFKATKTNINSECLEPRNPVNNNCVLFNTEFNEYEITRGAIENQQIDDNNNIAGTVNISITCKIIRHKLIGVTNPESTDTSKKVRDNTYVASYNVNFNWFLISNPFDKKQNFNINDKLIQTEFLSGNPDDQATAEENCLREIKKVISDLSGNKINYVKK